MGQEEVPGHVEAGGDGRAEQEGGGLEQGGAEAASINLRKNLDGTGTSNMSFSESVRRAALEKVEDMVDIEAFNEALMEDDGTRYSMADAMCMAMKGE